MRKFNRVIAAGALAVPMTLGVSGIAVADVAADGSTVQDQGGSGDDAFENCVEQAEPPREAVNCLDLLDQENEDTLVEAILKALLGEDDEDNSGGDLLS
jgi:hypothetical protein